jgi:alpha-mannosidase
VQEARPLDLTAFCVRGEPIGYADAVRGNFAQIKVGDAWGPPWSTTWFHVQGRVPNSWAGRRVIAVFDLGFDGPTGFTCEAQAWKDGQPWRGVDPNHRWLPIDGPDVDFYLEAAANPRATEQGAEPAASMIALRESPEPAFVLRQAMLALHKSAEPAPSAAPLDPSHTITAVGHAHIDTAWEWPIREAKRKVARSWSTQLALMDEHADYVFAASQPAQYAWMKDTYPDIYRRVREKVAAGQWEPVGAMWVEADCNLPSGESLVRQLLLGKRFFMQEFGYETKVLWLPDVFGYPGNLPQLMSEAGCDFFLTQKLSWNDTNKPDHHTFIWEGIDGSRIFTHFPPADTYNGSFSPEEVELSIRNFKDGHSSQRSLYLFGWGDGGGGPQPEMIESAHRLGVEIGRASDFFEAASAEASGLATSIGELYFELHRGTYTSQSRTKRLNRLAQQALREAEMWSVAAGGAYPLTELNALWQTLLLNQFHDILPGSSIDWVYEEAERDLEDVEKRATGISEAARSVIVGSGEELATFNTTSHPRREVVMLDGEYTRIEAPPCGWSVHVAHPSERQVTVSERSMQNELLRVEWDDRGVLTSIFDKEVNREVLSGPGNLLQLHEDNPARWDAWDLDSDHRKSFVELTKIEQVKVSGGDLRGVLAFVRKFGNSVLSQTMTLDAGSRVLRFETAVNWQEEHKMLKVAFPVTVSSRDATYEIQFGHLRRPTHEDTSQARAMFEVCAQHWADLGDDEYGIALLNDCKHGYDIHGSVMRLSLLRAPTHPDPTADRGNHLFTYALMPHPGDFREAGVIEAAEDLNAPLLPMNASLPAGSRRSLIEVDTPQVIVEAIKQAEDSNAVIVRLYEAWGRPCTARVRTSLPASRAFLCDLLERNRKEVALHDGVVELELTPFKIVTLKLEQPK